MANKSLFRSMRGALQPRVNCVNEAGGTAYAFEPKHALAQYVATGCLNGTFYATAETQLAKILTLAADVEPIFLAKAAVYGRRQGFMKDVPALLVAFLAQRDGMLAEKVFPAVIDSGRMLRNFVQILRAGTVGRKSLGSRPKRMVRQWIEQRSAEQLFADSIGKNPALADVIKMLHPRPATPDREALYGYLIGRKVHEELLPESIRQFERFKRDKKGPIDEVPFQFLTSLELTTDHWVSIAKNATWQQARMNLNTFLRHGVFARKRMETEIASKLRNAALVRKARVFPYQLLVAYQSAAKELPKGVTEALQDALEIAIENVPVIPGKVVVCTDVSGSMHAPVTGYRKGATSVVRCIDVAALVAAAMLRRNKRTEIIPFSDDVVPVRLNDRDSVMTNAQRLASLPSGGTNCSSALRYLNRERIAADLVVFVSDNESWIDTSVGRHALAQPTQTMAEWAKLKQRCPAAKMVCIDIQPYAHTQAAEQEDITNVGGFSDQVFSLLADVAKGRTSRGHWVQQIESVSL